MADGLHAGEDQDGLEGMAFIEAVLSSHQQNSRWVRLWPSMSQRMHSPAMSN